MNAYSVSLFTFITTPPHHTYFSLVYQFLHLPEITKTYRDCWMIATTYDGHYHWGIFTTWLHVMQHTVLLSQFCPSIRCMYCDKTKQCNVDILIPHKKAITLVFRHQQCLVGDAPFPVKYSPKVTHLLQRTPTLRHKHVLCRAGLTYNKCRQLHNELFGHRHSTPQSHVLSSIAELLVTWFWRQI